MTDKQVHGEASLYIAYKYGIKELEWRPPIYVKCMHRCVNIDPTIGELQFRPKFMKGISNKFTVFRTEQVYNAQNRICLQCS